MNISDPAPPKPSQSGIVEFIRQASKATGVNFDFLISQASVESGLNATARNNSSTATGLYQFTKGTWLKMVETHGSEIGLGVEAQNLKSGNTSSVDLSNILNLRNDPAISAQLAARYAVDNAKALEAQGHTVTSPTDLYLAHFLGSNGAARFLDGLKSNPNGAAANLLPSAASSNRAIFYNNGSARSFAEIYQKFSARLNSQDPPSKTSTLIAAAALSPQSVPPSTMALNNTYPQIIPTSDILASRRNIPSLQEAINGIPAARDRSSELQSIMTNWNQTGKSAQPPKSAMTASHLQVGINNVQSAYPSATQQSAVPVDTLAKFLDSASHWLPEAGAVTEEVQKGAITRQATDGLKSSAS
jgi:hypothetical protein